MLPAVPPIEGGWPVRWPTDGRPGGVPDPRAVGPTMIQIGNDGGLLPQAAPLKNTPVVPGGADAQRGGSGDGRVPLHHRHHGQDALPRARRACRRDRRLLAGPGRLQAHPLQRRPRAGPQRGQPRGLLHRRRGPDRHRRRARHACGLRAQHAHDPAVPGRRPGRGAVRPRAAGARAAGRLCGRAGPCAGPVGGLRRRLRSPGGAGDRRARRLSRGPARRLAGGGALHPPGGRVEHAHVHPSRPRLPADAPRAGQDGGDLFDPTYGRKTATLGVDAPLSASGVRTGVPYSAIDPATEYLAVEEEAPAPQMGDATQLWRITHDGTESHSIAFGGFDVQVVERARRDGEKRAPDPGELGWKDTLRVDPLESVLIAVRPGAPPRTLQAAGQRPATSTSRADPGAKGGFTELDPVTAAPLLHEVVNAPADLSFEAYWSIHLVGGEESHTARPLVLQGTTDGAERAVGGGRREGAVVSSRGRRRCSRRPSPATWWSGRTTRASPKASQTLRGRGRRRELHRHDRAERRRLLLPRPHRGRRRLVAVVGGRRGEPALRRRPAACALARDSRARAPLERRAAGSTGRGRRARAPTGSADGRGGGDRDPRRSQPRPRRLLPSAARQGAHRVRGRRRCDGRGSALGARPLHHRGHRPPRRGDEVRVLPRRCGRHGRDGLVRRLRRRRAADAVPVRGHGRLRLHARRRPRAAQWDPSRGEGRPHAGGGAGQSRDGHDPVLAARAAERDRRAHAGRVRLHVLRRLPRLPPPGARPRPVPRPDDRAPRRGHAARRDQRTPDPHQPERALLLADRLRAGDHRRQPGAAARVARAGDGAAASTARTWTRSWRLACTSSTRPTRSSNWRPGNGASRRRRCAAGRRSWTPCSAWRRSSRGAPRWPRRSTRRPPPSPGSSRRATPACAC